MNIFYLDDSPKEAAIMHCDKHCVKMILETAQLLCTAHRELDGDYWADEVGLYKSTHKNHPSAVWVRESSEHYWWTLALFVHLCKEYTARYRKTHKSEQLITLLGTAPIAIKQDGFKEPPQCMPDEYKCDSSIEAYRNYYLGEKMSFAQWNYSPTPEWTYA
jgi:hypothetical protein